MKKVVLTPNPYRDRNFRFVREAAAVLEQSGIETRLCLAFDLNNGFELPSDLKFFDLKEELRNADAMICFGGDGTILHSSKSACAANVPILGVNIGTVGFMAELESSEMSLLSRLAADDYREDPRMTLDVRLIHEGKEIAREIALNDAVITKGAVARVIQASVHCDGTEAMNFSGDGVIIATPTGSTAYSMSAGGPIVEPEAHSILITPICAHEIRSRCIVVSSDRLVEVSVGRINRRNAFLSVDGGRAWRVFSGDRIVISQSDQRVRLIRLKQHSFFETVNNKLK